jgi:di/tricarboxylate transporter
LEWNGKIITVATVIGLTVVCWCSGNLGMSIFGSMGVIALLPMCIFFGTGILGKDDFNSFPWTLVMLAMGGAALGEAVKSSGLLAWIANGLTSTIPAPHIFLQVLLTGSVITVVTSFISHTVGALIFIPMIQVLGEHLPDPHPRLLMMAAAMACSSGMAMPVSSFPNITASSQEDGAGRVYVSPKQFIRSGLLCSGIVWAVIVTLGYVMMRLADL